MPGTVPGPQGLPILSTHGTKSATSASGRPGSLGRGRVLQPRSSNLCLPFDFHRNLGLRNCLEGRLWMNQDPTLDKCLSFVLKTSVFKTAISITYKNI